MSEKSELPNGRDVVVIDLPLPSRTLSPNGRAHWRTKAKAVSKYRDAAYLVAKQAQCGAWRRWGLAVARVTFHWPDDIRRDEDNAVASLKPAFDGLVDAGLIIDDSTRVLRRERPVHCVDRGRPRVVIEVEECCSGTDYSVADYSQTERVLPGPGTPGRPREQARK